MYDILIIGGGPAGLTAAIYATRAGKTVAVLERETPGGQIVSAPLVENYPGILSISGAELAQKMTEQAKSLGAEFLFTEATGLSKAQNGFLVSCADGALEARTVILATGASHRKLGLSQEDALTGCGISYCAVCDGAFYDGADVAVVGGGDTALQDALFLANTCRSVTLIHRRDTFRASAQLVRRAQAQENIRILRNCTVQKLLLSDDSLQGAELLNGKTGETERIYVEGLFVAVGQMPQSAPFQDAVATENGYYLAGEDTKTCLPGIFAAGDGRKKQVRQLTTAVSDGAAAALAACRPHAARQGITASACIPHSHKQPTHVGSFLLFSKAHRTIRQADSARDFSSGQGLKSAGILCVFQTFQAAGLARNYLSAPVSLCGAA